MHDLVNEARSFAIKAHANAGNRRKYSLEPYEVHLKEVANIVASVTDDPEMAAAAWLHDTVEDTPVTIQDIERTFGHSVAELVAELTDVSKPSDGNRAIRKAIDRAHLAKASWKGKTIKLADLMNNCQDICAHDPEFAKVYLTEMAALLEVLHDGDQTLFEKASVILQTNAEALKLSIQVVVDSSCAQAARVKDISLLDRMAKIFLQTFIARNITRALPSIDTPDFETALAIMQRDNLPVVGIRRKGVINGYVNLEDPLRIRTFSPGQILADDASFSEVILALNKHDYCFVRLLDTIMGVIIKEDIQHPYMRMWLFGVITMLEMETTPSIERLWPNDSWKPLVSSSRLAKAESMLEERMRRNQKSTLLACLQFSDKLQILIENEEVYQIFGFPSKKAARKTCKDLESLRNNLAHSQDIVTHDFSQIAKIARRIESFRGD